VLDGDGGGAEIRGLGAWDWVMVAGYFVLCLGVGFGATWYAPLSMKPLGDGEFSMSRRLARSLSLLGLCSRLGGDMISELSASIGWGVIEPKVIAPLRRASGCMHPKTLQ